MSVVVEFYDAFPWPLKRPFAKLFQPFVSTGLHQSPLSPALSTILFSKQNAVYTHNNSPAYKLRS
jgi:hypothetical protein